MSGGPSGLRSERSQSDPEITRPPNHRIPTSGTLRPVTTPNRWLPVVGGVMMNMPLGTFYAMSAFMLPLENEFGWTRAQTSWVTTIGIVMIASWYVIAGWIQDRRGPQLVAAIGGVLFSLGLLLASFTQT